ncbi:ATP-binding cassette domain-containing protein [Streptomyces sp. 3MP-14]|uniref:ABC-type quaternary amine transporter n=1 Tax=Streptomyces mimosae TaxID=2586635 RepID=A0A5N6A095_9ACTN|nr:MULTISPECIES: ABC transporter ATP-binding protein [Streptomyces]KAB8161602.1 ATP-binding cassette domain-containing protein [Streptomyces mimosae]KAB8173461.1 ATP-binding cassette domain-containing protein [Streptomyces sp. 3MP-14]
MSLLELDGVSVRYGDRRALDGVRLAVAEGEIVCVLGPSGSGKSTLLRAVAGLTPVAGGAVRLAGRDLRGVPAHRRGLGLMFQDHQLFPQRDVAGNIAFGLRMRREPGERVAARVGELLALVGLPGAERRAVATLSGGEQQRVALARALAPDPRLLMLDEPLGQLDRDLRERLVVELRQLFGRLGSTVLAVTHDQGEAFALADRVVVMRAGRVVQVGAPVEVWRRPANAFVARFLGFRNVVTATVGGGEARTPWGPVPAGSTADVGPGERAVLVRPSGVRLSAVGDGPSGAALTGTVAARTFRGDHVLVLVQPAGGGPELEASCALREAPEVGATVGVSLDPDEVVVLAGEPTDDQRLDQLP